MERPIFLNQMGHTVDGNDGNALIVQTQPASAGSQQESRGTDAYKQGSNPSALFDLTYFGDDQKHSKHGISRAKVGDAVGHHRHGKTGRNGQQKVAAVHNCNAAGQKQEIAFFFLKISLIIVIFVQSFL